MDPPGFSWGGGIAARSELFVENDEQWAYTAGACLTSYARRPLNDRLSLSAQLDAEYLVPLPRSALPEGYSIVSASATGGVKLRTWRRAAVKITGGAYAIHVFRPWQPYSGAVPVLDVTLLQDFSDVNPLTARVSVGVRSVQVGAGWQRPLSKALLARLSAGVTVYDFRMPLFYPLPMGGHIGFAIEPRR